MPVPVPSVQGERSPLEIIRKYWPQILGGIFVGVIAISLVHGLAEAHLEQTGKIAAKTAPIGDASKPGLSGTTWVVPMPVRFRETFFWRIELRNTLDQAIRVSMEELWHPGMGAAEPSGNAAVVRSVRRETDRVWTEWSRVLAPGEEVTVWTRWRAWEPRALGLSAVLSWQSVTDPEVQGRTVASLRDIHVWTPWRTFGAHAMRCFVALLGILTVPLIIAVAGFWFQQHQQSVERQRQKKQAEIDRKHQEKQAEIDHKRQIWSKMLPTSHELNMEYYLPLKSAISSVERDLELFREASRKNDIRSTEESLSRAFHYFLLTFRLYRLASDDAGGFYFKNRRGERLVADLFNAFIRQMLARLRPYEDLSALLDEMDPTETQSSFEGKLVEQQLDEKRAVLKGQFETWMRGHDAWAVSILLLAQELLAFEVNSVYEDWYGRKEAFPHNVDSLARQWWEQDKSTPTRKLLLRLKAYGVERMDSLDDPTQAQQTGFMPWLRAGGEERYEA